MKRSHKLAAALLAVATIGGAIAIPALAQGPQQGGGWMQGAEGRPGAMMGAAPGGQGMMQAPGGMGAAGPGTMGMGNRMGGDCDGPQQARGGPGMGSMGGMGGMGPGMMGNQDSMGHMKEMHARMGGMMGGMGPGMMAGPGGPGMMGDLFGDLDANGDGTVAPDEARTGMQGALTTYDTNGDGTLSLQEFQVLYDTAIRPQMVDRFQAFDEDGDGQVTGAEITAPADWMAKMQAMRAAHGMPGTWSQSGAAPQAPDGE